MERQTLVFATERETKNTVRFQEEATRHGQASRLNYSWPMSQLASMPGKP